jgi:hypothetical protein
MKVQAPLGHARGTRRERDQAHIVLRGGHRGEWRRVHRHARVQIVRIVSAPVPTPHRGAMLGVDPLHGGLELLRQSCIGQGVRDTRLVHHHRQLDCTQHRHGGDGNGAGLEHREPGRGKLRAVESAQ